MAVEEAEELDASPKTLKVEAAEAEAKMVVEPAIVAALFVQPFVISACVAHKHPRRYDHQISQQEVAEWEVEEASSGARLVVRKTCLVVQIALHEILA